GQAGEGGLGGGGVRDVEREGAGGVRAVGGVQLLGEGAEPVFGAGGEEDAVALGGEAAGRRRADAGRGAGDEDGKGRSHWGLGTGAGNCLPSASWLVPIARTRRIPGRTSGRGGRRRPSSAGAGTAGTCCRPARGGAPP